VTDRLAPAPARRLHALGMAKNRDERGTRYPEDDQREAERERRHRRRQAREQLEEQEAAAKRERRERRRAEEARRAAEVDIEDIRARRESYYSNDRRRTQDRSAPDARMGRTKEAPHTTSREVKRDGTRRSKSSRRREAPVDDRDDDFVYGRPKSRGVVEETIRRSSTLKRSDEGNSSSRTAYTPISGSGSASLRRVEVPKLSR
jgi:hypothetical protein